MWRICIAGAIRGQKMALMRFSVPGSANLSRWLCVVVSVLYVCCVCLWGVCMRAYVPMSISTFLARGPMPSSDTQGFVTSKQNCTGNAPCRVGHGSCVCREQSNSWDPWWWLHFWTCSQPVSESERRTERWQQRFELGDPDSARRRQSGYPYIKNKNNNKCTSKNQILNLFT